MLTFFDADDYRGTASIYESHITFNKPLVGYMKDAYRVRVGADKDEGCIYIFPYDKDKALDGEVKASSLLPLSVNKSYVRICSKGLIDYISSLFDLKIPARSFLRFKARYIDSKNVIKIDIREAV